MDKEENIRIIYIGFHPDTLIYIDRTPLIVTAVSYLDFLASPTLNPVSILFALVYTLHAKRWPKKVVQTIFFLWLCLKDFSPTFQIRYSAYLEHIIKYNIQIIDATNIDIIETAVRTHKVNVIFVNGWSLLPKKILELPPMGIINVHPSKLPKYKGALPTLWALKNKDSSSAISLIKLLPGVDDGPLLSQREFLIPKHATAIDVEHEIDGMLKKYLWSDLIEYLIKKVLPIPQSGESSTTDKYMAYREIKWESEKSEDIMNKILLYPYLEPKLYAYAYIEGRRIPFKNAHFENTLLELPPGKFTIKRFSLDIQTISGSIKVDLFKDISILDSFFILRNRKLISS